MSTYSWQVSNTALNTAADIMTLIPASARAIQLIEVSVCGMGTASAANELGVYRSTAGTTGGGPITASKFHTDAPAAGTVVNTTWAAQPTLGQKVLALGVNANGGIYRWVARPGEEVTFRQAVDQISLRSVVGTSSVSVFVVVIEDPL